MTLTTVLFRGGPLDGKMRQIEGPATLYEVQMEPSVPLGTGRIEWRTGVYRRQRGQNVFEFFGTRSGGVR